MFLRLTKRRNPLTDYILNNVHRQEENRDYMTLNNNLKYTTSTLLIFFLSHSASISQVIDSTVFDAMIPFDSSIRRATLANGFSYFIRKNSNPDKRIVLSLVVKAGALQEDKDQLELAHLLEHLPFVATSHFSDAFNYFEKKGLERGKDINATTGDNSTTYYISLPSDDSHLLKEALLFLRDCAQGIKLTPEIVDKERHVVLEEIKGGHIRSSFEKYRSKLLGNSKYAARMVLDTKASLLSFKFESLLRFYRKWYRPNLQSIIVVGDIETSLIEPQLISLFSDLKNPDSSQYNEEVFPLKWDKQVLTVVDREIPQVNVEITVKKPYLIAKRTKDIKTEVADELLNRMMAIRFNALQEQYSSPIKTVTCRILRKFPAPCFSSLYTNISFNEGRLKEGFLAVFTEFERISQFGFTHEELVAAKFSFLSSTHSRSPDSKTILHQITDHFVSGSVFANPEYIQGLSNQFVGEINLNDISDRFQDWNKDENSDIIFHSPPDHVELLPTEETVLSWKMLVKKAALTPYQVEANDSKLMTNEEISMLRSDTTGGVIGFNEIGVTKIILKNGIKVFLKPSKSDSVKGMILLEATKQSCASCYTGDDYITAQFAAALVSKSGLGPFNQFQLKRFFEKSHIQRVKPYINDTRTGITASAATESMEVMLQSVYKYLVDPNKSEEAFNELVNLYRKGIVSIEDPQRVFTDTVMSTLLHGRSRIKLNQLKEINLDEIFEIYKQQFADVSKLTIVMTGNFEDQKAIPLVRKYFGSIPSTKFTDTIQQSRKRYINHGRVTKHIYAGQDSERAEAKLIISGYGAYRREDALILGIISSLLQDKLTNRLRVKEGKVYTVSVVSECNNLDSGRYQLSIEFASTPRYIKYLIQCAVEEVDFLKQRRINKTLFKDLKYSEINRIKKDMSGNDFWLSYLGTQRVDLLEVLTYESIIKSLSRTRLKEACQKYLRNDNLMEFILLPKKVVSPAIQIQNSN